MPVRDAPASSAIRSVTLPFPVPDAPAATVIQSAPELAVHAHDGPAVTETSVDPPFVGASYLEGAIE